MRQSMPAFPHRFTYPLTAVTFGPRRHRLWQTAPAHRRRSLTNSALFVAFPMFIHRIRIRQNDKTIGRYLLRQQ